MTEKNRLLDQQKYGIYLNVEEVKATRVNSPHWIAEEPGWFHLTPDVNITLSKIHKLAGERGLVSEPDGLFWS